jgi:hypothetical protein
MDSAPIEAAAATVPMRVAEAEAAMRQQSWETAIARWTSILADFEPPPIGAYVRLARAYAMIRDYENAERVIDLCLQRSPTYVTALDVKDTIMSEKSAIYNTKFEKILPDIDASLHHSSEGRKFIDLKNFSISVEIRNKRSASGFCVEYSDGRIVKQRVKPTPWRTSPAVLTATLDLRGAERLGLTSGKEDIWIWRVNTDKLLQVVTGTDNWLFLANDTNKSVDIYTGKYKISDVMLTGWQRFFERLSSFRQEIKTCFLVAPTKEQVHPEYYPYTRGAETAIDQLLGLRGFVSNAGMYPLEQLRAPQAYCKTDTHWTDYGAYVALTCCLEQFGLDVDLRHLHKFSYIDSVGDLGSKVSPAVVAPRSTLMRSSPSSSILTYTNHIDTGGSVTTYTNEAAPIKGKLLIFGDSFSAPMMNLARDVFSAVTRIYSPASPIVEAVKFEEPTYIILQTNERFIVNNSIFYETLDQSLLMQKINKMGTEERNKRKHDILRSAARNIYSDFMLNRL